LSSAHTLLADEFALSDPNPTMLKGFLALAKGHLETLRSTQAELLKITDESEQIGELRFWLVWSSNFKLWKKKYNLIGKEKKKDNMLYLSSKSERSPSPYLREMHQASQISYNFQKEMQLMKSCMEKVQSIRQKVTGDLDEARQLMTDRVGPYAPGV
jgi:hypothetical protein